VGKLVPHSPSGWPFAVGVGVLVGVFVGLSVGVLVEVEVTPAGGLRRAGRAVVEKILRTSVGLYGMAPHWPKFVDSSEKSTRTAQPL
jgi:hypothetical protein